MSDFTSLWLQDEGGVYLYVHYNNSETSPRESRHWYLLLMPRPSLSMPAPLRHNCPSLQRVSLRGLSQLGVNLSQWPAQNRRSIRLPQGGTYSVINLDLELRGLSSPSHPIHLLYFVKTIAQPGTSTSGALMEALLKEWRLPRMPDVLGWAATGDKATDCQTAMVAAWRSTVYSFPTWISWSSLVNLIDGTSLGFLQKALPLKTTMSIPNELI